MLALLSALASSILVSAHEERSFLAWMRTYNTIYTGEEYQFRLGLYLVASRHINEFNKGDHTFTLGINQFACMTPAEYHAMTGLNLANHKREFAPVKLSADPPAELDWRTKGIVTPASDQGMCGSCWAFSAVCAFESQIAKVTASLVKLSEQNMVDCCDNECFGCEGGMPDNAMIYIRDDQKGKISTADEYPYLGKKQFSCHYDASKAIGDLKKIKYVGINETEMKYACAEYGVLSACIDSSNLSFMWYSGGVYYEPECNPWGIDHAISIVGYGTETGGDYWIVKNSWGHQWGEDGYIKMARNRDGNCGIDIYVTVPLTSE